MTQSKEENKEDVKVMKSIQVIDEEEVEDIKDIKDIGVINTKLNIDDKADEEYKFTARLNGKKYSIKLLTKFTFYLRLNHKILDLRLDFTL